MIEQLVRVKPVNQILKIQALAWPIILVVFWMWQGQMAAIAAVYGAVIVLMSTLMMKWHLIKTARMAATDPVKNMSGVFRCIIERWVITIAMFVAGFVLFETTAIYVIAGFIIMQVITLIANTKGLR